MYQILNLTEVKNIIPSNDIKIKTKTRFDKEIKNGCKVNANNINNNNNQRVFRIDTQLEYLSLSYPICHKDCHGFYFPRIKVQPNGLYEFKFLNMNLFSLEWNKWKLYYDCKSHSINNNGIVYELYNYDNAQALIATGYVKYVDYKWRIKIPQDCSVIDLTFFLDSPAVGSFFSIPEDLSNFFQFELIHKPATTLTTTMPIATNNFVNFHNGQVYILESSDTRTLDEKLSLIETYKYNGIKLTPGSFINNDADFKKVIKLACLKSASDKPNNSKHNNNNSHYNNYIAFLSCKENFCQDFKQRFQNVLNYLTFDNSGRDAKNLANVIIWSKFKINGQCEWDAPLSKLVQNNNPEFDACKSLNGLSFSISLNACRYLSGDVDNIVADNKSNDKLNDNSNNKLNNKSRTLKDLLNYFKNTTIFCNPGLFAGLYNEPFARFKNEKIINYLQPLPNVDVKSRVVVFVMAGDDNNISSLLKQSYSNLEIIRVLSAVSSTTSSITNPAVSADNKQAINNIKQVTTLKEYFDCLLNLNSDYVMFQISPQTSAPTRIEDQLTQMLKSSELNIVSCQYDFKVANADYDLALFKKEDIVNTKGGKLSFETFQTWFKEPSQFVKQVFLHVCRNLNFAVDSLKYLDEKTNVHIKHGDIKFYSTVTKLLVT